MNNNYKFYLFLLAIPVMAILFMNYSGGQVSAYSGSPGDGGNTCAVCHAGSTNHNAEIVLTTDIPESGYLYNQEYAITLSVTSDVSKHGFQVTAEKEGGVKVGVFTAGTGSQTNASNTLATHNSEGNTLTEWTFNWTAPTSGDEITFYAVVNATNSNYQDTGDQVVTTNLTVPLNTVSIAEIQDIDISIYPNPTTDLLHVKTLDNLTNATYSIINYQGKKLIEDSAITNNTSIDVSSFANGSYLLKISSDEKEAVVRFIKK